MAANRLEYRNPKRQRAVCVYTISQESRYLIIENVPSLGVTQQLLDYCQQFGAIEEHRLLDEHSSSTEYTDVYLIQYTNIKSARIAKHKMDDRPFYTNLLRVNYAPEYETLEDIRKKFKDRYQTIFNRNNKKRRHHHNNNSNIVFDTTTVSKTRATDNNHPPSSTATIDPKRRRRI
ncbi:uncharacterized protein BX663DRAFT_504349 [Cokeromyces recurvatus]|uniref:uncharacterized protein n=1 Tax=Cokeromyces recurvatus TaxID=90255 RepID=UPI002220AECE|nr:uncharacterized protein BX663DRAFT_504349 [Cokeromyces recurvatus]KAI7904220.1 hypothetical protein BX663DRAFT_504349 [Cokeromyces recurvatus]